MKDKKSGLFSISKMDSEYFNDGQDKIELIGDCPHKGINCTELLSEINQSFLTSSIYLRNKDYQKSIEALKHAFLKTAELKEPTCIQCNEVYRSTIIESMEYIHEDLQKMTTGLFRNKRYQDSYELACSTLKEFKQNS